MDYNPTIGEIGLIGYIVLTQGVPWLLRTLFPAVWSEKVERRKTADEIKKDEMQYRKEQADRELDIKRELAQKEIELRREIADRDAIIDARNFKTMELMEKNIRTLTDAVGAMTMQFTLMGREIGAMRTEQQSFFSEGRKAHQQINKMDKKKPAAKKATGNMSS